MRFLVSRFRVVTCVTWWLGCGAGGGDDPGGSAPTFTPPPLGGVAGASSGTTNPVNPMASGNGTPAAAPPAAAGQNTGAPPATSGAGDAAGESNGNVTPIPPGSAGTTPASGGDGAAAGAPPSTEPPSGPPGAGGFQSVDVDGGASAAFVCPVGESFGNPLAGMGAVQTVRAPTGGNFSFIEGPVWVGSLNRLFFSDNASNPESIWQLDPPFNAPAVFMADSGSNGLALDNDDQLVLADEAADRITVVDPSSPTVIDTLVAPGSHEPNDLIMRSDGNLYSTDPSRGFFRRSPAGEMSGPFRQGDTDNAPGAPNGIVLSPDENTLFVGDVQQRFVAAFDLLVDGSVDTASGRVFVRPMSGTVDGMAVDCAGNLYVGTDNNVEVYAPDATLIGTVPTGYSSNATFGGPDRRTLFVTSRGELKFVTLGVPGLPD